MQIPRFYPILDTEAAARHSLDAVHVAEKILAGGAQILQFRHKGFFSREVFTMMERIAELCRDAKVPFVVNDRSDLAKLMNAALHLGQEDLPPSAARRIVGSETAIGFSTHNEAQLRAAAAEPADYLALGPIFGTASKLNPDPVVGLETLRRLRPFTPRPLVAIGGITRANARKVIEAGADSVAVIGDLFPDVRARVENWLVLLR
ncbi:MAG TPA: thiamine phosphate synthase [Bryobacteraceae bacterium]|jgi:thiamine-phosphate pyrophosphorylase